MINNGVNMKDREMLSTVMIIGAGGRNRTDMGIPARWILSPKIRFYFSLNISITT